MPEYANRWKKQRMQSSHIVQTGHVNHHTALISVDLGTFPGGNWPELEADEKAL
jgi:hypothetical protein